MQMKTKDTKKRFKIEFSLNFYNDLKAVLTDTFYLLKKKSWYSLKKIRKVSNTNYHLYIIQKKSVSFVLKLKK